MRETTVLELEADAPVAAGPATAMPGVPGEWRGRRLILATAISVAAAALATALAMVVSRRRVGAGAEPAPPGARSSPTSTINVNWGFALFGTNVMAERRRRAGRLFGRRR